uniref:Putative transporter C5D6.04 n=1 Tax=Lygus hesperus TaxID=30085 RepID=A0A0A9WRX5_LYGHE
MHTSYCRSFSTVPGMQRQSNSTSANLRNMREKGFSVIQSLVKIFSAPPLLCSVLGLIIGVTPPLHQAMETDLGMLFIKAFQTIGSAAIPLQLMVLGCTISSAQKNKSKNEAETSSLRRSDSMANDGTAATLSEVIIADENKKKH